MLDIKTWMNRFTEKLEQTFTGRVWFIGLQGSYNRGEATDASDIDVVAILDELRPDDLKTYRDMLDTLPNRELICGFLSGKAELLNWEASDLFQFYYDTTPIKGTLDILLDKIDRSAVKRAIRIGACNIYHACVHNYIHEKSDDVLRSLCKSAVFVIQAVWFYETGNYIRSKIELQNTINPPSAVLAAAQKLKNGESVNFEEMSMLLLNWAKSMIVGYGDERDGLSDPEKIAKPETGKEAYPIRKITADEVPEALHLAMEVFMQFEAPEYKPQGVETFKKDVIENAEFIEKCKKGICPIYAAFDGEKIIGIIGMRNASHISLVFTKKEYHRRGVATSVFAYLLTEIKKNSPSVKEITLNSSPYGKNFYLHLGFVPLSKEQEIDGIRFTPMKYAIK